MVAKKRVLPTEMVFILSRFKTVTFNLLCTDNTSRVCFHFYSLWYYQNPIRNKGRKNWIATEMKREKNWRLESSLWLHSLPLMSFLSTFSSTTTPLFSCDVLFEWPLTCFYYYITLCPSNLDFPYVTNMFFWCLKIFLSIIFIFSFDKIMQCKNAASPKLDHTLLFSSKFSKFLEYFKMAAFELKCWAKSNCLVSYNIKIRILLLVQNQRSLRLNCWIK